MDKEVDETDHPTLDDFTGAKQTDPSKLTPEEQKRKAKRLLIVKAKQHQRAFFRFLLKSMDRNSISWRRVVSLIRKVLAELEKEDVCYLKTVPKGKARLFKRFYCRKTLDEWRECPDYFCRIWYDKDGSECPFQEDELPMKVDAEIVLNDHGEEDNQPDGHRENSSK